MGIKAELNEKGKENNYYTVVVEAGKDPNGKRARLVRKHIKGKGNAQRLYAELLLEVKTKKVTNTSEMTFEEYTGYWLNSYAKTNTKPRTFDNYLSMLENHLIPYLGKFKLTALTSVQIQNYHSEKLKILSAQSVKHHHRLLSKMLNDAVGWEYITKNVMQGVKAPKPVKKEMTTLDEKQLNKLLEVAEKVAPLYFPAIYTAAHTGMRKSEINGLRWKDVDFANEKIRIIQTVTYSKGKYNFSLVPKNGKVRTIKMTKGLTSLLKNLKEDLDTKRKKLGSSFNPIDLVFCNSKGNLIYPGELSRGLKNALKAANLPDIRFHDLRHSMATIMFGRNIHPKLVSERLGHSKISITLDLYSHVIPSIEEKAVDVLNDIFKDKDD